MSYWTVAFLLISTLVSADAKYNDKPYVYVNCEKGTAVNMFGDYYCRLEYHAKRVPKCQSGRLYDESVRKCRSKKVVKSDGTCSYPTQGGDEYKKVTDSVTKKTFCINYIEPLSTTKLICKDDGIIQRPEENDGMCWEKTYKGVSLTYKCEDPNKEVRDNWCHPKARKTTLDEEALKVAPQPYLAYECSAGTLTQNTKGVRILFIYNESCQKSIL